jgi:hypothetical protein
MKILTSLIAGSALMLGTAFAQNAPAPAAPVTKQAKVKKHRKHHKKGAAATATTPAASSVAPTNVAPKK